MNNDREREEAAMAGGDQVRIQTFEVAVLDLPGGKHDLVAGTYAIAVDRSSTDPVAVRITDMLGEEILVLEPR